MRARSRALRAAIRAWLAETALRAISRPSAGFASNQAPSWSNTTDWTTVLASVLPSLVFVWPSNCGSRSFTLTMAVSPSRMSSPERLGSFSLRMFQVRANLLTSVVSAARNPSSCAPPSVVLIVLAKV